MKKRYMLLLLSVAIFTFTVFSAAASNTGSVQPDMKIPYGDKSIDALRYGDASVRYYTFAMLGTADWVYYTDDILSTGDRAEFSKNADYFALEIENFTDSTIAYTFEPAITTLENGAYKEGATLYIGSNATVYLIDGKTGVRSTSDMIAGQFAGRYCYEIPAGFSGYVIVPLDALSADPSFDASSSAASTWSTSTHVFSRFSFWFTTADPTNISGIANGDKLIKGTALIQGELPEYSDPKEPEITPTPENPDPTTPDEPKPDDPKPDDPKPDDPEQNPEESDKPQADASIKYGNSNVDLFMMDSMQNYTDPIIPYVDMFGEASLSKQWRSAEYQKEYMTDLQKSAAYFALAVKNTSGGTLLLNWQPFVYLDSTEANHYNLYTTKALSKNNVWLVNKQGVRSVPTITEDADNKSGRDTIVIPAGFDGYVLFSKNVLSDGDGHTWSDTAGLIRFNEFFIAKENEDGTAAGMPEALNYVSGFYTIQTLPEYNNGNNPNDNVNTGDVAHVMLFAILLITSGAALALLRRKASF